MYFDEQLDRYKQTIKLWGATIATFATTLFILAFVYHTYIDHRLTELESTAHQYARRLIKHIDTMAATTQSLRVLVDGQIRDGGLNPSLEWQLDQLRGFYPHINSFQIAQKGVVTMVSAANPAEYAALGTDLFREPRHKFDAQRAVERNDATIAGPLPLPDGDLGIIVRTPVFDTRTAQKPVFWGFVQSSASIRGLLQASGISDQRVDGLRYEMWRLDESSGERWMFSSSQEKALDYTVDVPLDLADSRWLLSIEDTTTPYRTKAWFVMFFVPLLLAGIVAWSIHRSQVRQQETEELLEKQHDRIRRLTALIDRYQNIFDALDAGIVQWNKDQRLETWNVGFEKIYPRLVPHLEKGMTRRSLHQWRERFGETEVTQDWESTGTWYRQLADGRIIMLKRTAMPDGGRLGMHMDMTHALGDQEYD